MVETAPYECVHCGFVRPNSYPLECPKCGKIGVYAKAAAKIEPAVLLRGVATTGSSASANLRPVAGLHGAARATTAARATLAPTAGLRGVGSATTAARATFTPTAGLHGLAAAIASANGTIEGSIAQRLGQLNSTHIDNLDIQAILTFGDKTAEGVLVEGVSIVWFEVVEHFRKDPDAIFNYDPRKFEELIAGAYERAGYDEVKLTPRSNDKGRDVIAVKRGIGSVRILDQAKRYRRDRAVSPDEVRALIGVLATDLNASKAVMTTTSTIAPSVYVDYAQMIPHRLELKPGDVLIPWLQDLAKNRRK